jgi:hypothetical protein
VEGADFDTTRASRIATFLSDADSNEKDLIAPVGSGASPESKSDEDEASNVGQDWRTILEND